ncbi:energy transducer TonB [Sphingomicrobium sp. XHP0235]|uniref:energy transducer TonB n=1 Tax=Sphingomicrobium aquimarinum TaxID=3133971 RepID=UPI0031FF1719
MLNYAPRPANSLSPKALAVVVALHGVALAAVLTMRSELVMPAKTPPTVVTNVPLPPVPPEPVEPSPPSETPPPPAPQPEYTVPTPRIEVPTFNGPIAPTFEAPDVPINPVPAPRVPAPQPGSPAVEAAPPIAPTSASLITSGADLKPPYPAALQRRGEEAALRLRLEVDARGRVVAVTPLNDADPRFVAAAEKHLKRVWRYEPATRDGKAVATSLTVTLRFELQ